MKETDSGVKHPCRRMISASCSWVTWMERNEATTKKKKGAGVISWMCLVVAVAP